MAQLATQQVSITGLDPAYTAAAGGGDTVVPSARTFLHVKNGSGAPITVTVVIPGTRFGQANPDVAVSVPAADERMIGPLTEEMADPTSGLVNLTYSGVTSLTVAAIRS